MKPSIFVGLTAWGSILIVLFGVLFKFFDNNFTTWTIFAFFCIVGFFAAVGASAADRARRKESADEQ